MRERKSAEILAAARELFLRNGFGATSIEAIASTAGVSKATVYSNFVDKDALLVALLDAVTMEAADILQQATAGLEGDGTTLRERFVEVGMALVAGVLRPEVLSLRRLAVAQASAFPEAVERYWMHGPAATVGLLTAQLERLSAAGELTVPDAPEAAVQFAYALVGPLQDRALLMASGGAPTTAAISLHVESTVDAFLRAYAA